MTIQANYISKDQNSQDETTIYWFDVEHENHEMSGVYGVADSSWTRANNVSGNKRLLDDSGCPYTDDYQFNEILEACVITNEMINDY